MTKVTWGGIKPCPVPGCNYRGPMGDLGKHVAMNRDFPHTTWGRARKIPECPLPSEPGWSTKGKKIIKDVSLILLTERIHNSDQKGEAESGEFQLTDEKLLKQAELVKRQGKKLTAAKKKPPPPAKRSPVPPKRPAHPIMKVGDYIGVLGDETAVVENLPPPADPDKQVAWVKVIESNSPRRVGMRITIALSAIVKHSSNKGKEWQVLKEPQGKKIIAKSYEGMSPEEYALTMAGAEKITPKLRKLMELYMQLSDNTLLKMLEDRKLSTAGAERTSRAVWIQFAAQLAVYKATHD